MNLEVKREMQENVQTQNKMGSTPVLRLILTMSLPAMFSMMVQALYNIVDSYFVAKISDNALAAVSLAFPIQTLLVAFAVGTSVGTGSLISRRLGEGRKGDAENAAMHGLLLSLATSLIFAGLSLFALRPFYGVFTDDPEILEMGVQYLEICCILSFGNFLQIIIEKVLQATGNMIWPMIIQLIGAVVNIILDPIMIFGYFGFPEMGIAGAALATVVGQIIGMIVGFIILFTKDHAIHISFKGFRLHARTIKDIYIVGIPAIVMQAIGTIMTAAMNFILAGFSAAAYTVFGLYFKLQSFVFMPIFGLTQGLMPIMGYNYGARNKKRMMTTLKYGTVIAVIINTLGMVLFLLIPGQLLRIFTDTQSIVDIGVPALRIICISFIPAAISIAISTLFQAVGKGVYSLVNSLTRQLVVLLPVAFALSFIGLEALWFAFPIAEAVSLALTFFFLFRFRKQDKLFSSAEHAPVSTEPIAGES